MAWTPAASAPPGRGMPFGCIAQLPVPREKALGTSAEQDLAQEEEDSEQMRLLYVALTRAIYCTFACWGRISDME